jgi:hypothetical protein
LHNLGLTCPRVYRYCSQIWLRGGRQLRPWEFDELLDESQVSWHSGSDFQSHEDDSYQLADGSPPSTKAVSCPTSISRNPIDFSYDEKSPSWPPTARPRFTPDYLDTKNVSKKRLPIFGPEKVVLDPRVRAIHKRTLVDIYHFGFWCTLVSFVFFVFFFLCPTLRCLIYL